MPLHLLGKKSWNVYAPANIERVRKDEAAAAAKELEDERRMQEYDAERRLAILRGEHPLSPQRELVDSAKPERRRRDEDGRGDRRRRRRRDGETDTDRDIRIAREDAEVAVAARDRIAAAPKRVVDAPLLDRDGHINLFPADPVAARKAEKNVEAEAEAQKKKREFEDQYTMRFSNAAGRGAPEKPWYADDAVKSAPPGEEDAGGDALVESKNVWGRPDPKRKDRSALRTRAIDPLALMKRAQSQLKDSERDRQKWREEKDRHKSQLKSTHEAERRKRHEDVDDMEHFSLDAPRENHGHHRRRSKSRERGETSRRRRRSRSPESHRSSSHRHRRYE